MRSVGLAERESLEEVEIPEAECDRGDQNLTASPRSCWEAVAQIKRRCQTFQACCPAVKRRFREKHIVINRKSLECRNRMREILEEKHAHSPKAHGVSIAQMEKVVVDGRSSLVPFKRPTSAERPAAPR
ncbi:hypothetical protein M3Y99_00203200 [Aphelenchoides fujianensis]|nr:hypothetical protein M3Y99_00203200 [Aphelenchoides fujianensis]